MTTPQHKELLSFTQSIQGAIECAKGNVFYLKQQLADAQARIAYLEAELELHKEKAEGLISRDQFNKFYMAARGRPAFDYEWSIFFKHFRLDSDEIFKKIESWIDVMGPLIRLGVFQPEEDPQVIHSSTS